MQALSVAELAAHFKVDRSTIYRVKKNSRIFDAEKAQLRAARVVDPFMDELLESTAVDDARRAAYIDDLDLDLESLLDDVDTTPTAPSAASYTDQDREADLDALLGRVPAPQRPLAAGAEPEPEPGSLEDRFLRLARGESVPPIRKEPNPFLAVIDRYFIEFDRAREA